MRFFTVHVLFPEFSAYLLIYYSQDLQRTDLFRYRQSVDVHDDGLDAEKFLRSEEPVVAAVQKVPPLVRSSQQLLLLVFVQVQVGPAQQGVDVFV